MADIGSGDQKIYAGIDEAGYGPLLGPLAIARTVFRIDRESKARVLQTQNRLHNAASIEASETWLPDLWSKLGNTVCRTPREGRNKIAVNDSKILYQSGKGLRQLEKGVLSFLESCGIAPGNLSELLTAVSLDSESADCRLPWYRNETGAPELPLHWPKEEIHELGARLRCAGVASRAQLIETTTAVVFADRLNDQIADTGSKAAVAWRYVASHLSDLWKKYGRWHPLVVVDRQGGRKNYRDALASLFLACEFTVSEESSFSSRYL